MDTKEQLQQLVRADKRISALLDRRDHYRAMATRGTSSYTALRMGGTNQHSNVEEYTIRLVELAEELNREVGRYVTALREARAMIDILADDRHRDVLTWRYINGWGWDKIADAMEYDRRQTTRLHGEALAEYTRINNYYRLVDHQ